MIETDTPKHIPWYRCPVDRDTLKTLNAKSDFKGFLQAGGHLGLLLVTGIGAWYSVSHWPWYATVAIILFHGTCHAFLLNGFHELVHGTVFKTKKLNVIFLNIYSFLSMHNPVLFWASHTEHHKYTLHPPRDLEVVLPYSVDLKGFLRAAVFGPEAARDRLTHHVRISRGKLQGEWEHALFPPDQPEKLNRLRRWARVILFGHLAIAAASILSGQWILLFVITLAPFTGGWLLFLCNNTQHAGLVDNVPDYRLCCRTMIINPFFEFLYWQMNYHTEHHMYAAVPCYNLKKLHRAIKHDMPPCPRGLYATWKQIIGIQRRQKTEPDYQYVAPLPQSSPS